MSFSATRFKDQKGHDVKTALIYARVSGPAQVKRGDGLKSQEARSRAYAEYKNYDVLHVFTDDMTGRVSERRGLDKLLAFLKSQAPIKHVVIIDELSRFARNLDIHKSLKKSIIAAGGIMESPGFDFRDDADGRMNENIQAAAAQHQSEKNAEQTVNRMWGRLINGYWVFAAPVGYKYERREGHGKLLVRDEPLASIVEEGLRGYASGRFDTQVEVKRFFESQPEFPKDLPNGLIRNQRVHDILTRMTYTGYIEVPKWEIPLRKGHHEGLISLETYEAIQLRLKSGARVPARADINEDFPLRGVVCCGDCDRPLTACWSKSSTGKKHAYYLCHNRGCESRGKSIPRDRIEGEFEALLGQLQQSATLYKLTNAMFRNAWDARLNRVEAMKVAVKKDVAEIDRQLSILVDRILKSESETAVAAYCGEVRHSA